MYGNKECYSSIAPTPAAGLMHGNIYQSMYQRTTGPHSRAIITSDTQKEQRTFAQSNKFTTREPKFQTTEQIAAHNNTTGKTTAKVEADVAKSKFSRKTVEGRHDDRFDMTVDEAFAHRPTVGWQSSYSRTFDGWQAKANLEKDKREEKALPDYSSTYVSREAENDVYRGSFRYNDLRKIPAQSNYTKDFGVFGDSPKDRIILNPDGTLDKYSLSKFSTSRDISHGRNGASVVPGYTGFLPRSGNAMNGKRPSKTLLTQTFTHNMPGYTGYKPSNVINDRGKRKPTSEQNAAVGMSAGLIVPSMSPAVLKARLAIQASGKKIALHHM